MKLPRFTVFNGDIRDFIPILTRTGSDLPHKLSRTFTSLEVLSWDHQEVVSIRIRFSTRFKPEESIKSILLVVMVLTEELTNLSRDQLKDSSLSHLLVFQRLLITIFLLLMDHLDLTHLVKLQREWLSLLTLRLPTHSMVLVLSSSWVDILALLLEMPALLTVMLTSLWFLNSHGNSTVQRVYMNRSFKD